MSARGRWFAALAGGALVGLALAAIAGALVHPKQSARPSLVASPAPTDLAWAPGERPAPPIALRDTVRETATSLAAERGHDVFLAFLDSHCEEVCPIEGRQLAQISRALALDQRPVILAVSVNPADTAGSVRTAASEWGWKGLDWHWVTGGEKDLAQVWRSYGIAVHNGEMDSHTPAVYLIDPSGDIRAAYLAPIPVAAAVADVEALAAR